MLGLVGIVFAVPAAQAQEPIEYPSLTYTPSEVWQIISPDMGDQSQLQPEAVNGHIVLGGNARHEVWDIEDPYAPSLVSVLESPFANGEAEAHNNSQQRRGDSFLLATISGRGVDLWDLTDPAAPIALSHLELDGISFGDNTEAVWGLSWQGDVLYVGGTNTGIHVVDTADPTAPVVVTRIPTSAYGGVSAGPLWAIGNTLLVTPPKDHAGLATLDISDPWAPTPITHLDTPDDAYIGGFYGTRAYLVNPWRTYEVLADPTTIVPLGDEDTPDTEYMVFADGHAFVGAMRPNPGIHKWDVSDPTARVDVGKVEGRRDGLDQGVFTDDQFALPVGNLLVMCDDELRNGCVLAVHDAAPDAIPPALVASVPADGATGLPVTTRIGLSMTDQLDLRSVDPTTVELRPLDGGEAVPLAYGLDQTLLHLSPLAPLAEDTSYEVVLHAGGLTDLAGNGLANEVRFVFTTGDGTPPPPCTIEPLAPAEVGASTPLSAAAVDGAAYTWTVPGAELSGQSTSHVFDAPGRFSVGLSVERDGVQRNCTAIQIVQPPMPEGRPAQAHTLAVDDANGQAWVVNPDAGTVARVDLETVERIDEVEVGGRPRTIALDEGGTAWVAVQDTDRLVGIGADGTRVAEHVLPWGARPYGVVVDGDLAWLTLEGRGALIAVNLDSGSVEREIGFGDAGQPGPAVRGLALSPDRTTAWVTRFLSTAEGGTVYAVDLDSGDVEAIPLVHDDTPDSHDGGRGIPNALSSIALTPDGTRALVPGKKDNVRRGEVQDGEPLDPDNTVRTLVAFLDTASRTEAIDERVDIDDHEQPFDAVFSPWGDLAFVVSQGTNRIDVLETWSGRLVGGINTGFAPNGAVLDAEGRLWVQELNSRSVSVFDVSGFLDGSDTTARALGSVATVAEEPLSEAVWLGKVLFMNANNSAMSQDGYMACSSCHPDGGHDGMTWDFTQHGEGLRNTIDLRGRAGTAHGPVHWTANFDEIQDFENDIRASQGGSGLLDDADWLETSDPLGTEKSGRSERLDALAAYVSTFDTFPRSPYRNNDGSLTEAAVRGQKLFERLDCLDCHSGDRLTDSAPGIRHDVGTATAASGGRLGEALDGFDTPTLYGLHATAPYLHDGSAETLDAVLAVEGHGNAQGLSDDDRADLVAFLLQLEPDVEVEPRRGCGCATGTSGTLAFLPVIVTAILGRRRRARNGV
jgi:uncharacterized protein (TIGR03382 family)